MTRLLHLDEKDMAGHFPARPFRIGHDLASHPLFSLPRLIELARSMDRDRIEYNSGKLAPNQRPEDTPRIDLSVEETIRQIEDCHAWMVIKRVESDPEYGAFLKACLAEVQAAWGEKAQPMSDIQGFIFVSSANSVTPFHIDAEDNFFLQIKGRKRFHIFDNEDRSLVSEREMEISPSKHRNQTYLPEFEKRGHVHAMAPGDGLFVPYMWPHWVETGGEYCISVAVTWKTPRVIRMNRLRLANGMLRGFGLPQAAPGERPFLDGMKVAALEAADTVARPLRKAEWTRRLARGLLFGRKANYYYEG